MTLSQRIQTPFDTEENWLSLHSERRSLLAGLLLTCAYALVALGANGPMARFAWISAGLTSLSGLLFPAYPRFARGMTGLGTVSGVGFGYWTLRDAPTMTLATLVLVSVLYVAMARHKEPLSNPWRLLTSPGAVRGAVIGALSVLVVSGLLRRVEGIVSGLVSVGIVLCLVLGWALIGTRGDWLRRALVVLLTCLAAAAANWLRPNPIAALAVLAGGLLLVSFLVRRLGQEESSQWGAVLDHPARLVVSMFAILCVGGTILLALPTSAEITPIDLIDAAFTAVSAVCVTGLSVVDTPTSFSFSGEVCLALLIQLGGLGIMALYTTAFGLFGRRLSIRHEHAVASAQSVDQVGSLFRSLATLVGMTLLVEAVGAFLLFARFVRNEAADTAMWRAVFHAVSAFCNAGFALQSDNLVAYAHDPWVLHVIGLLVVLGGLSPALVLSLHLLWGKRYRMTVQSKLALAMTAVLLVFGFVSFLAFEWTNTLSRLSLVDKLHNAWFQSVTPRTAGFNSIDFTQLAMPTRLLMIVLMFIGGCPGSTAGGIKTTTAAVLVLSVVAALRGRSSVIAFGHRLPSATAGKAMAIATIGMASMLLFTLAVFLTQNQAFDVLLFEVTSALGTVGLSLGATANLDDTGKILIMACMFIGRVGPLTMLLLLGGHDLADPDTLPEQDIQVG